jgi:hypothetical protein
MGEGRLPILAPQFSGGTQGYQALKVSCGPDAAKVVIATEAGSMSLVDQPQERAILATRYRLMIEFY